MRSAHIPKEKKRGNPVSSSISSRNPLQLKPHAAEELLQQKSQSRPNPLQFARPANTTGLPDNLKSGIENLSGFSLDDVKVHYNSDKPGQLQAHAFAQGNQIHVAPGQEEHLPHEAWHVVQQKQGRVQPTMQMKGNLAVNDDPALENEADVMGAKALNTAGMETSMVNGRALPQGPTQKKSRVSVQSAAVPVVQNNNVMQLFLVRVRTGRNERTNDIFVRQIRVEGRPPTTVSGGQGDHTVAEVSIIFLIERMIEGRPHNEIATYINQMLSHVEEQASTRFLSEFGTFVPLSAKTLGDDISKYQQLVARNAEIHEINEALETLVENFIRLWNKTVGSAYQRKLGKTTGGSGGQDERNARKELSKLGDHVEEHGSSPETVWGIAMQITSLIDFKPDGSQQSFMELANHAARAIEIIISAITEIEIDYEEIGTIVAQLLAARGLNKTQGELLDLYIMRKLRNDPNEHSELEQEILERLYKK